MPATRMDDLLHALGIVHTYGQRERTGWVVGVVDASGRSAGGKGATHSEALLAAADAYQAQPPQRKGKP